MNSEKQPANLIRRTAKEVKGYRTALRITPIFTGLTAALLLLVYAVSLLYSNYGAFTVKVDTFDNIKYALSLSDTRDFASPTAFLNAKASEKVTNIKESSLPKDLDAIDGSHNGENYIAYTFYCKNAGTASVTVRYKLFIANATRGIDKAVRIRLYVNGDATTFARTKTDGTGPEEGTTEFRTAVIVTEETIERVKPGDVTRFTVVVWLEGDDPDCVDEILGGQFKIDMEIAVSGLEDNGDAAKTSGT